MFRLGDSPILSPSGIEKLKALINDIATLTDAKQYHPNGSSEYSRKMVEHLIAAIDMMISNNTKKFWDKTQNQELLKTHLDFLDNERGTYVPDIFNQQSQKLCQILQNHLQKIDLRKDMDGTAATLISALVGNPNRFIESMKYNLAFKLDIYARALKQQEDKHKYDALVRRCGDLYGKIEDAFKRQPTPEEREKIIREYQKEVAEIVLLSKQLPYLSFGNLSSFIDKDKPYLLDPDNDMVRMSGTVLKLLISNEERLNKTYKTSQLTAAYDVIAASYNHEALLKKYEELRALFDALKRDIDAYKKGEGSGIMSLFKSVDPETIETIKVMIAQMEPYINKPINESEQCARHRFFEAYKAVLIAARKNEMYSASKKMALGRFSKLINGHALQFLALTFSLNETHEQDLVRHANGVANATGKPHISLPEERKRGDFIPAPGK